MADEWLLFNRYAFTSGLLEDIVRLPDKRFAIECHLNVFLPFYFLSTK